MNNPLDWEEKCMDCVGEILAAIEKYGASGGTIPLHTNEENVANFRAKRLIFILGSYELTAKFKLEDLSFDIEDNQYRISFMK